MANLQGDTSIIAISEADNDIRLDQYLSQHDPALSRSQWQRQISLGHVLLNGQVVKSSRSLKEGDKLTISSIFSQADPPLAPHAHELNIIYEDTDVLVIDKPAGLVTHPSHPGRSEPSVAGAIAALVSDEDPIRPGIVHRLDKATSGVMIVAKNLDAKSSLQAAFKSRAVEKHYLALVWGEMGPGVRRLNFALSPSTGGPTAVQLDPLGKPAESFIQVVGRGKDVSLLDVRPTTGRTHQIRVHCKAIGHPIVGDTQYGHTHDSYRLMLHAHSLTIPLPNGQTKTFTSQLPPDFTAVLKTFSCNYEVK